MMQNSVANTLNELALSFKGTVLVPYRMIAKLIEKEHYAAVAEIAPEMSSSIERFSEYLDDTVKRYTDADLAERFDALAKKREATSV